MSCLSASKPPPTRHGVSPSSVFLPEYDENDGAKGGGKATWPTVVDFLIQRFPGVPASEWLHRLRQGDVVDDAGQALNPQSPYTPQRRVYYYRAIEVEPHIPFDEMILWQDEHLLVVDKPHFLPVLPSGKYLQETVLVRLKNKLGLNDLVPIHRIDRDTAGLVLFSIKPATRDAYHALFREREVHKTYEAIARWNPDLPWPLTRQTRIEPSPAHFMQQAEVDGPPNSLTHIAPLEVGGDWARYELKPVTGHRHQLRVHMAALGLPLLGDGIYPILTPEGQTDYERPLQLLAKSIEFTDPLSGQVRQFESQRTLRALAGIDAENPSQIAINSPSDINS
jgi:tRNA pseudouridine32 synthase/23S rRNA pseudouridine746 synthase